MPIETSNAPPVRSNTWRAITRHSSVDGGDPRALARGQVVDPRDVAVGEEPAQLALEAVREIEGRLRRLRRVPLIGMHGVHLEHGMHRLVREAPHVARARRLDPEPAIFVHVSLAGRCGPDRPSGLATYVSDQLPR